MATVLHPVRTLTKAPIYYGWIIWGVALLGILGSAPGQAFTVSLFIDSYIADFFTSSHVGSSTVGALFGTDSFFSTFVAGGDMGRTAVSGLFAAGTFISAMGLTFIGKRIDLYGNRRMGTLVAGLFAIVLVLNSFISGAVTLFLSFIAIRILGQGSMFLVGSTAVSQWWRARRGWVMGLALVGFALFQSVYIPSLQQLIEAVGWRTSWIVLGAAVGLIVMPIWWMFMRDRPEQHGLVPDGDFVEKITAYTRQEVNWTLAEAQRTFVFWVFVLGRFVGVFTGSGLVFHQVSVLTSQGFPTEAVGFAYGLLSIVNAISVLVLGRIVQRIRPGLIITSQMTLMIVVMLLAGTMTHMWMLYLYAIIFGMVFAHGGTFEGTIWANVFGRQHIGSIRGFSTTALVIGSSLGPLIFGYVYDQTGSYMPVLLGCCLFCMIPLLLGLFGKYPVKAAPVATVEPA